MKLIFLDIDGVCNTTPNSINHSAVLLLKEIVEKTGCEVVLSSTWRKQPEDLKLIKNLFLNKIGKPLYGTTPISDEKIGLIWRAKSRGEEILDWFLQSSEEESDATFVILDDGGDMHPFNSYLVRTDSSVGLTPEIAKIVIKKLNQYDNY